MDFLGACSSTCQDGDGHLGEKGRGGWDLKEMWVSDIVRLFSTLLSPWEKRVWGEGGGGFGFVDEEYDRARNVLFFSLLLLLLILLRAASHPLCFLRDE